MPDEAILRVAVPAPLHHPLDYLPPADCPYPVQPGMRVIVPLGARRVVGIVTGVAAHTKVSGGRLKRALDCLDAAPLLSPDILELCDFAARYYYAAPGEALVGTLPLELRTTPRARLRETLCWNASPESQALPPGTLRRAPRQAEALAQLQADPLGMSDAECQVAGIGRGTLRALAAKGWATAAREPALTVAPGATGPVPCPEPGLALNPDQAHALEALIAAEGFRCSLLEGVTGSGKTEVYLQFIAQVLLRGRQALVLVPEIGLTPLTRRRFTQRFGNQVGVLHSGLTEGARLRTWQDAASGRLRVLIGTRSALFSPLPALGAIIVDEEHDTSFKQQDGFRYSARDLAVFRGRQLDIPVVLGSATPSTESLANCAAGRFHHLSLPHRAGGASPPAMRLLDLRARDLDGGLCQETLDAIGAQLRAGNQVLVFLNRRGWAPLLSCGDCGWMAECRHCDARLTLHRADRLLWCHHCDARVPAPAACPGCRSARLLALGTGTERSEHALQRHFPQVPIRRIDRGTMQGRGAMDELLTQLESGQPCILVGTQMLAKGHHFPAVTLVVIVDIDGGLFSSDLRAAERTGQLLIQVAGRAGRADRPGEVLIQTLHPDHPWLQRLVQGGYRSFIDPLLAERQLHGLPPFAHLALLRAESTREDRAIRLLTNLKRELQPAHPRVNIVGPVPAPLARRAGRFRVQLLMKHPHRAALHAALEHASKLLETRRTTAGERWHIDVDPVEGV